MQGILYVTTFVVFTQNSGAIDTNVTVNIIENFTSVAKHTMTTPNSTIENAPEHDIVKSLTNLMLKVASHAKEQAKPIFRNEYEKSNDININIKVNYENKSESQTTKQEDDVNNIKNGNRKSIALKDYTKNAPKESYEILTGNLIKKEQCEYKNTEVCKVRNNLQETVFVPQDNTNHSENDDIESDAANAEKYYYADSEDDSNGDSNIQYLVEYDETLIQMPKESKFQTRFNIIDQKRANNNKKYVRESRQREYKKPNLLLNNEIMQLNASKANTPNNLREMKRYDKIVREVTGYPHVKNKRFKILSRLPPKIKKIIKAKKVANGPKKKFKNTKKFKFIGIKTNNNINNGDTSKYKFIASQSNPNKQWKQKHKWKFDKLYNNQYQDTSEGETQDHIHDSNKTRVRQNNNYDAFVAAKEQKSLREDIKTFNNIPIQDKDLSSNTISPKDNIKTLTNASDNKLMDTLANKLSQDLVINNLTDYLLTKMMQRIAVQNKLARRNGTVDERIVIDLKGELTEVESEYADWSEPSQEIRVLGGTAGKKLNFRLKRLQVK